MRAFGWLVSLEDLDEVLQGSSLHVADITVDTRPFLSLVPTRGTHHDPMPPQPLESALTHLSGFPWMPILVSRCT